MNSHTQTIVMYAVVAALLLWRVGMRVWKLTSRQRVRGWALQVRSAFSVLVLLLLVFYGRADITLIEALVGGCVAGFIAGYVGLRGSTFENTPDGLFVTPHRGLGAAIALIFVGRLIYRSMVYLSMNGPALGADASPMASLGRSPLTMALTGLFFAYVLTYSIGVLRWYQTARVETVVAPPSAQP